MDGCPGVPMFSTAVLSKAHYQFQPGETYIGVGCPIN